MSRLKDSPTYRKMKRFLKQIRGKDLWTRPQMTCPSLRFGNWCVSTENLSEESIVYSFGIGEDVEFDLEMIRRFGLSVFAFDPTPNTIAWLEQRDLPDQFVFHPYGVSSADEVVKLYPRVGKRGKKSTKMFTVIADGEEAKGGFDVQMHRLKTIMERLGHTRIDVLKMDIEAAEYAVIDEIVASGIEVDQILVEFHHRFKQVGVQKTRDAVAKLDRLGYKIFFISEKGKEYSFIKCG